MGFQQSSSYKYDFLRRIRITMKLNNYDDESETLQYLDDIAAQGIFGV